MTTFPQVRGQIRDLRLQRKGRDVIMTQPESSPHSAESARINWGWLRLRTAWWRCRHDWRVGSRMTGAKACARCGVWRWWPVIKTPAGGRAKPGPNRRADDSVQREVAAAPPAGPINRPGVIGSADERPGGA